MKFDVEISWGGRRAAVGVVVEAEKDFAERAAAGELHFNLEGKPYLANWAEVSPGVYSILLGRKSYEAQVFRSSPNAQAGNGPLTIAVDGVEFDIKIRDPRARRRGSIASAGEGPQEICSPMPGRIVKLLVSEGSDVKPGDGLVVIEAMKMQNEIRSPRLGRVDKVLVAEGAGVEAGTCLLRLA
jgi:biotin carboxyl carrier protein